MTGISHDDIAAIVGDIDDVKAAEIIATGATIAEIEEAAAWAAGKSELGTTVERPLTGAVAEVYDILTAGEEEEEERAE